MTFYKLDTSESKNGVGKKREKNGENNYLGGVCIKIVPCNELGIWYIYMKRTHISFSSFFNLLSVSLS